MMGTTHLPMCAFVVAWDVQLTIPPTDSAAGTLVGCTLRVKEGFTQEWEAPGVNPGEIIAV